jgi:hypothetical protein
MVLILSFVHTVLQIIDIQLKDLSKLTAEMRSLLGSANHIMRQESVMEHHHK